MLAGSVSRVYYSLRFLSCVGIHCPTFIIMKRYVIYSVEVNRHVGSFIM